MNEANHDSFVAVDASALADGDGVRAVGWAELSARLAATRELARLMRKQGERRPASFGRLQSLANAADTALREGNGKERVNQHALGNGKIAGGKVAPHHSTAATGDRGNE